MITNIDVTSLPDVVRVITEEDSFLLSKEDNRFVGKDMEVSFAEKTDNMPVSLKSDKTPIKFIQMRWHGEFNTDCEFMGDSFERGYGDLEWRGFVPNRPYHWYFLASTKDETQGFGVMVRPNSFAYWHVDYQGITLWLDTRCGGKGVILNNQNLELVTIVSVSTNSSSPYEFLQDFCGVMCKDPILTDKPVYGSNNWYYAYGESSHEQILRDSDLLAELTDGLENRPYMVIDDCWQPLAQTTGAAGRPYEIGNSLFPDMSGLAKEMRAKGVIPGIWVRPQRTDEIWLDKKLICDHKGENVTLDITEPEALKLIAEDINRVTSWGYELVKFDFATVDSLGTYGDKSENIFRMDKSWAWHDRSKTNASAILDVYRTILENSNGAVIIGCNVIGHLAAGLMHMHRSGDDTSGKCWDRSMVMGINTLAFRLAQHKKFFLIDADCVGITGEIDWKINRKLLKLFANSGTPLFCSIDPDAIDDNVKKDVVEAFKLASIQENVMVPLNWMDTSIPTKYLVDGEEMTFEWLQDWGMDWLTIEY